MYSLKGFATHANLINNTQGVVAPYGELSTQSSTYSREKGFHKSILSNDITLISFSTKNNGLFKDVNSAMANNVVTIVRYLFEKSFNTVGQLFSDELANELLATYSTIGNNFTCGPMVESNNHYAPEWVSWRAVGVTGYDVDNVIKIWLSDTAFKLQYDEFSIVVVPPIVNMDDFFRAGSSVDTLINSISQADLINKVQIAKGNNPESFIRAEHFDYIDPVNPNHRVRTTWHVLIYGVAGNTIDSITDALTNYVLARSQHTREEWIQILPDLFKRTEFVIVPFWNVLSMPNRNIETGIYSPVTSPLMALNTVKHTASTYNEAHINTHLQIMSNPYKSLQMGIIGGADNRDSLFKFTNVFTDYINAASTSHEFGRMLQRTQDWATMLAGMLVVAEAANEYTTIPLDMTKTNRDGRVFIVKKYGNINYLVATKNSVTYVMPP